MLYELIEVRVGGDWDTGSCLPEGWDNPEHMGRPVSNVFALMLPQKGKEILTDNNIPHGQCVICLYGFQVGMCLLAPQAAWEVRQENGEPGAQSLGYRPGTGVCLSSPLLPWSVGNPTEREPS